MQQFDLTTIDRAAANEPGWVRDLRTRGFAAYEKRDMPSPKEELWRYVELGFDIEDFGIPEAPGEGLPTDDELLGAVGEIAGRASIVDGVTVAAESFSDRITFLPLAEAFATAEPLVRGAFGQMIDPAVDKFAAAHQAFGGDGIFLYVPAGTAEARPFYVEVQAATPDAVSFPHITVVVEDDAEASLLLDFRSGDGRMLIVPEVEVSVRDAARFRLATVQDVGRATTVIGHQRMAVGRDATAVFGEVGIGGDFARLALEVDCFGQGSSAQVVGAYFGEEDQVLDYRYRVNHVGLNTTSDMFLKGAVEDRAQSVFTGMIHIEPGAQKTGAYQTNKNLVLSEGAQAQSVPNLEILANDVKCSHGSTVTPLDPEQRYYLMSRGLDERRSDRLQVQGFFAEVLDRLPVTGIAGPLQERIIGKFVSAQQEGRV